MAVDQSRAAKFATILKQLLKLSASDRGELIMFQSFLCTVYSDDEGGVPSAQDTMYAYLMGELQSKYPDALELGHAIAAYLK